MKLNSDIENQSSNKVSDFFDEINLIALVLVSMRKDLFDCFSRKKSYEVAEFLYDNGIRKSMLEEFNLDIDEVNSINSLLICEYRELFDNDYRKIYGVALYLVINGIRRYMFDVKELDIEEIVGYLSRKRRCIRISNLVNNVDEVKVMNKSNGQVINMLDYLSMEKKLKRR